MKNRRKNGVFEAIRMAAVTHRLLTAGTILCAAASVAASLVPPLLLACIIDGLMAGLPLTFLAVLLYFGSLALEGILSSAQESLLVLFGQKMTHALRSEMSRKLTKLPASTLVGQNPGEVAARFSGDVDTVEALFTSGIISMVADACRILSDYQGKTVFLNFWATWCGPCKMEMPDIQALYEDWDENAGELVVLGVAGPNIGQEGSAEDITAFLEENGYTYPVVMDETATLFYQYAIRAYPTTFMIDTEGNVFGYVQGAVSREVMDDIVEQTRTGQRR